jgi:hypothetical protein
MQRSIKAGLTLLTTALACGTVVAHRYVNPDLRSTETQVLREQVFHLWLKVADGNSPFAYLHASRHEAVCSELTRRHLSSLDADTRIATRD